MPLPTVFDEDFSTTTQNFKVYCAVELLEIMISGDEGSKWPPFGLIKVKILLVFKYELAFYTSTTMTE